MVKKTNRFTRYESRFLVMDYLCSVRMLAYLEASMVNAAENLRGDRIELERARSARDRIRAKLEEAEYACILPGTETVICTATAERKSAEKELQDYKRIHEPVIVSLEKRIENYERDIDQGLVEWKRCSDSLGKLAKSRTTEILKGGLKFLYRIW